MKFRGLQRDPARPVPTGGDRGDRQARLTGIELNSGGFLPPVHIPTFDDIPSSDTARDDFIGLFEGTGVEIAGLNCNGNPLMPAMTGLPR